MRYYMYIQRAGHARRRRFVQRVMDTAERARGFEQKSGAEVEELMKMLRNDY